MSLPSPQPLERRITVICLALALAVTLFLSWQRLRFEARTRQVEIALPEKQMMAFTVAEPSALETLRRAGVTTLVREPYTLEDMLRYNLAEAWQPEPDRMEIRFSDERLSGNAAVYLTGQLGLSSLQIRMREGQYIFDVKLPFRLPRFDPRRFILEIPFGPMPDGYRRALRLPAGDWGQAADLDQFIQALYSLKPDIVIPDWRGGVNASRFFHAYLNTTWLRKPLLAVPEFDLPAAGARSLRLAKNRRLIRAHLLYGPGISAWSPGQLRQRLIRAVRERGVRLLYLNSLQRWNYSQTLQFVAGLKQALQQAGFAAGPLAGESAIKTSLLAQLLILLGAGALFFIFIWRAALWATGATGQEPEIDRALTIRLQPAHFRWSALAFTLAVLILTAEGPAGWGAKVGALAIAVLTPIIGFTQLSLSPGTARGLRLWQGALADFGRVTVWSLAGGLAVGALLYRPEYLLRLDRFAGVRVAFVLPLAVMTFYLFPQILDPHWWRLRLQPSQRRHTLAGLALILAALVFLLWHQVYRESDSLAKLVPALFDGLEERLGVRPRLQEFWLGHPLLLAGLAGLRLPGQEQAVWPKVCLLFGVAGQASLLNAFCSVHTPLAVSLLQVGHGLWLGGLLGSLALLGLSRSRTGKASFSKIPN